LGRVIFVTAFKGGVGKTTVSAGIAAALSALGKRVCVLDADFGMRCMDLVLGMEDRVLYDCSDVLFDRCSPEDAIVPVEQREPLFFMPAPIRYDGRPFPRGSEEKLFSYLRKEFDYCIVDSSAEMSGYYRRFAMQADEAVVVSLHQSTAIRAAEKTAANLASLGHNRVRLVVNCYRAACAEDGRLPTVLEMIRRSSIPLLGVVPISDELPARQEKGTVLFGGKEREKLLSYEAAFLNVALRLCECTVPLLQGVDRPKRKKKCFSVAFDLLRGGKPSKA
jgi:septum site-determining protein MinD